LTDDVEMLFKKVTFITSNVVAVVARCVVVVAAAAVVVVIVVVESVVAVDDNNVVFEVTSGTDVNVEPNTTTLNSIASAAGCDELVVTLTSRAEAETDKALTGSISLLSDATQITIRPSRNSRKVLLSSPVIVQLKPLKSGIDIVSTTQVSC
jgi:hypothetical protein